MSSSKTTRDCSRCNGHGSVPRPGWPRRLGFTCPACDGTGDAPAVRERCCGIIYEHGALSSQQPCHDCPEVKR